MHRIVTNTVSSFNAETLETHQYRLLEEIKQHADIVNEPIAYPMQPGQRMKDDSHIQDRSNEEHAKEQLVVALDDFTETVRQTADQLKGHQNHARSWRRDGLYDSQHW